MKYDYDCHKWVLHNLPPILRKNRLIVLILCLINGVIYVASKFESFRKEVEQRITHDGSVMSIEDFLNDLFKLDGEIYLEDYVNPQVYLHYQGEILEDPIYVSDTQDNVYLRSDMGKVTGGFKVMIPTEIDTPENRALIIKWVEYYRSAGTSFKIENYG